MLDNEDEKSIVNVFKGQRNHGNNRKDQSTEKSLTFAEAQHNLPCGYKIKYKDKEKYVKFDFWKCVERK